MIKFSLNRDSHDEVTWYSLLVWEDEPLTVSVNPLIYNIRVLQSISSQDEDFLIRTLERQYPDAEQAVMGEA